MTVLHDSNVFLIPVEPQSRPLPAPSQDCFSLRRLYPAVHMHALVDLEVGRHSCEQSPLLLLHRLVPGNRKSQGQTHKVSNTCRGSCALGKHNRPSKGQKKDFPPTLFSKCPLGQM